MPRRFGRPGLIGAMARTAAITGTATAVHRSMTRAADRRTQDRAAADAYYSQQAQTQPVQQPAVSSPPAAQVAGDDDLTAQLRRLGDLHAQGILSDTEFTAAKARLLS